MGYNDNPRRVFGKISIVYVDSELSMDLVVETSGNGEISNPEQVHEKHLTPTIKACTMDGISTMGGGYQMNDVGLVTGWWSNVHSNENGVFNDPPWIKLSFIERPMLRWILMGDNKLNQYPVDFNLELYQGEDLADTREIRGNDKVGVTIRYAVPFAGITSIKMIILRWSHSNTKAKLLQFFDIVEEEYDGSSLKDFEILEELCKEGDSGFGINSDSATFTIYNKDRKFDRGYLKSLVILGRKVTPYIGVESESGEIEYTKFGTFYADDWNIPQSDVWLKLKCVDKLASLQKISYIGYPYTEMTNLYEIAETILKNCGFKSKEYKIDEKLKDDIVDRAFLQKGNAWECLQSICYAGLCNAFITRDDVLNILKQVTNTKNIEIKANSIVNYAKHTMMTDFCNSVEVNYTEVIPTNTHITVYESIIPIEAGATKTLTVDYSGMVQDASISYIPSVGIELVSFESGVNAGKVVLKNTNSTAITTNIKIKGYSLSMRTQSVEVSDAESIEAWGKQEYVYEGSDLIQSYEKAEEIGKLLLNRLKKGNGNVKITWRGDPKLELQDSFISEDRYGSTDKCVNEQNLYKFDGGLKQYSRGRLIDGSME